MVFPYVTPPTLVLTGLPKLKHKETTDYLTILTHLQFHIPPRHSYCKRISLRDSQYLNF
jgi:hypothetical protein